MIRPSDNEPKPRVLVIDEDQRTADSLAFALDISGFRAKAAYTGQQAMELAATQPFHFVVSDALAEIKGVKASLAISEVFPDCKVLLMSTNGDSVQFIELARTHGYRFDSFAKPAHPGLLIEKLREYASGLQSPDLKVSKRFAPLERSISSTPLNQRVTVTSSQLKL